MTAPIRKQTDRFAEALVDEEIVLMDTESGRFLTLRGTGAAIWRMIDGETDRETLIARLQERFDGPRAAIADDLDAFMVQLRDARFVA